MRLAGICFDEVDFTVLLFFCCLLAAPLCFNGTQQEGKCQDEKMVSMPSAHRMVAFMRNVNASYDGAHTEMPMQSRPSLGRPMWRW